MSGYYLGLDMGTSSIGWAVTDENYNILRAKGKDLWGVREFEEAHTAAERRTVRVSRRRRQREVARIGLLKSYFADAIEAVDPYFYQRLENSKYFKEDKDEKVRQKYALFADKGFTDEDYFKRYPTIFHLRSELLNSDEPQDVRLVFLALLNMFKHRGHFFNATLSGEDADKGLQDAFTGFANLLQEECGFHLCENYNYQEMEEILTNTDISRKRKVEELTSLFGLTSRDKQKVEFLKAICGLKVNGKTLFAELELEEDKKVQFSFTDIAYNEKAIELEELLGRAYYGIVESMKQVYDSALLQHIMRGYPYLSEARVADYEKHAKDLSILKKVIKKYSSRENYDKLFRTEENGTYSAYVNSFNSVTKSRRGYKDRTQESLYKTINKMMTEMPSDDVDVIYIKDEIAKENFLPKQLTASNGVIPNQVHEREMVQILKNAEKYLPFLCEKDESGYTVSERIVKLFTFQIPYYIGPTSEDSCIGWVKRMEKGPVLPWNLEQKIDVKRTSEEFIARMVRRCTYVSGERVLPKASLEYEAYCVLNEINNICIDGERISVELKQAIYNRLFKKGKKVTRKSLEDFLKNEGVIKNENQLSGVDIAINNSLSSYGKFKAVLGDKIEEDFYKHMVEDIIFWCTVYGDIKSFVKDKIRDNYGTYLTEEQINRIAGFKFKDWGRLSKQFLEMQGCDKAIGESMSLIRMMWETNLNLMELLHSDYYTYKQELADKQDKSLKSLTEMQPEDLDEFYFSAPVKRMVWQTLLIIRELELVLGAPPEKLFVEMTRRPDEKPVRTVSRKNKFLQLYKDIKDGSRDWKEEIQSTDADGRLNSKKMYLYFCQMGRCMYTGEEIDLSNLDAYDIDHIYPRHFVKDDNLDNNLVLVKRKMNQDVKKDFYPVPEVIRGNKKVVELWNLLLQKKFMNEEKYRRLTGRNPFTEEQKADFIARQLVETSQGTKGVTDILRTLLPETTLVFSKASNVSEFRQSRDIPKTRLVNEFHHAHDAYLNIVVGNVYYTKFTQNPLNFIRKEYGKDRAKHEYHLSRMFDFDVTRNGYTAWRGAKKGEDQGTIVLVKKMLSKNTPLITRRNFEEHGAITKLNPVSAKTAAVDGYLPLKCSDSRMQDVTKYGGYQRIAIAYFCLVEHGMDDNRILTLEGVPVYLRNAIDKDIKVLLDYCENVLQLINPRICMRKIKKQSLIKKDGFYVYISAKSDAVMTLRNAVNLCLKLEWIRYIKVLENMDISKRINKEITTEKNIALYDELLVKHTNSIYANRPSYMGGKIRQYRTRFIELDILGQCTVLKQLLNLSAVGGINSADLSLIGGSAQSGILTMSRKVSGAKELILINQSVTGLFENRIDLLSL